MGIFTLDLTPHMSGNAFISARLQVGIYVFVRCNGRWEKYQIEGRCNPIEMFKGYAVGGEATELDRLATLTIYD
jgi:hypothetical protein